MIAQWFLLNLRIFEMLDILRYLGILGMLKIFEIF